MGRKDLGANRAADGASVFVDSVSYQFLFATQHLRARVFRAGEAEEV